MEALAALSLACNIIQLVEFSSKIVSGAKDLYKAEATQENEDLTDVRNHLSQPYIKAESLLAYTKNNGDRDSSKILARHHANDCAKRCRTQAPC